MLRGSIFKSQAKRAGRTIKDYEEHSPMWKNRHYDEEKRSKLFYDKPFIWGRLPKFIIAWALGMTFWSGYYMFHKHTLTM